MPIDRGAVATKPCRSYSRRPGSSAINDTYAPAGAADPTRVSSASRTASPMPRRWWPGSTAMSTTWKYHPPSPTSRPMPRASLGVDDVDGVPAARQGGLRLPAGAWGKTRRGPQMQVVVDGTAVPRPVGTARRSSPHDATGAGARGRAGQCPDGSGLLVPPRSRWRRRSTASGRSGTATPSARSASGPASWSGRGRRSDGSGRCR